jgi:micrococcal nuclease
MRRIHPCLTLVPVLVALLALPSPAGAGRRHRPHQPAPAQEPFSGRVVRVLDGDTIEVLEIRGEQRIPIRIRLDGIDCPEKAQAYGQRAKQATLELAGGKTVTVKPKEKDRYGRTIAEIELPDGKILNHELVRMGLAWWYRKYAPGNTELEALEREAKERKAGLWAEPEPQAPWDFRRSKRSAAPAMRRSERR